MLMSPTTSDLPIPDNTLLNTTHFEHRNEFYYFLVIVVRLGFVERGSYGSGVKHIQRTSIDFNVTGRAADCKRLL